MMFIEQAADVKMMDTLGTGKVWRRLWGALLQRRSPRNHYLSSPSLDCVPAIASAVERTGSDLHCVVNASVFLQRMTPELQRVACCSLSRRFIWSLQHIDVNSNDTVGAVCGAEIARNARSSISRSGMRPLCYWIRRWQSNTEPLLLL